MAESFEEDLVSKFTSATEHLPELIPTLKTEQLLEFYAYYKQATIGKCQTQKPNWYAFEAKQKWDAWKSLGDMSKEDAMASYISLMSNICPDWESTDTNKNGWVSVSCMANEDFLLEECEKNIFDRVKEGDIDKVKQFAKNNQINVLDDEGMGLIHWASDRGNTEMVKCLLDLNANIDLKDNAGQTALHYACSCGHYDVVKLLLDKGANPSVTCDEGCLPIDIVTEDNIRSLMQSV